MKEKHLPSPPRRIPTYRPFRAIGALLFSAWLIASSGGSIFAQDTVIAYAVPANLVGNQGGLATASLGFDFDVDNEIIVTRLGVFDENSDGLKLTITAKIWDRGSDPPTEVVSLEFT